jgi:anthranilate synthase component I
MKTRDQDKLKTRDGATTGGQSSSPASLSFASDIGTPVGIFEKLSRADDYAFLFESTEGDGRLARYSFIGVDPRLILKIQNGCALITDRLTGEKTEEQTANPIQYLANLSKEYASKFGFAIAEECQTQSSPLAQILSMHGDLPFLHGFVGYMGYETCTYIEPVPRHKQDLLAVPEAYYGLYDSVVVFDHQFRRVSIISLRGEEHVGALLNRVKERSELKPLKLDLKPLNEDEIFRGVETSVSRDDFIKSVQRAKDYIAEGQVFQLVLSQRFSLPAVAPPIDVYRMLVATNPSPYAYYLKFPEFAYLGSSPETFVQCRDRLLMLRALAGTRPRGATAEEDALLADELKKDEKEMAEHCMLVDLGRNDLGRVSIPGSVRYGEIGSLTKYTHVMHLATEITGELAPDSTSFDAFQSCFPAGTLSGAPKVRAMQLIAELEPEDRGVYGGSVGYFDLDGNLDGAIAIRSALVKDGQVHVNAGAGLVYDSKPEAEYQETRNKAKSVLQAVKLAERAAQ